MPLALTQSRVPLLARVVSIMASETSHLETAPVETGTPAKHKERSSPHVSFFQPIETARDLAVRILRDQIEMQVRTNVAEERECC